jgi:hypothetical protein
MKKLILFSGLLATLIGCIFILNSSNKANAFSDVMPDNASYGNNHGNVKLVDQASRYVRDTNTNLRVWSLNKNINVSIKNPNFCASNNQDYLETEDGLSFGSINNGARVTNFVINGDTMYGYKYGAGNSHCNDEINVSTVANQIQPGTNYYFIEINITHNYVKPASAGVCGQGGIGRCDGISNGYSVNVSNNDLVGLHGNTSGRGVTMEQMDTTPQTLDYYSTFGTPCTQNSPASVPVTLYDIDNKGGSGAQPNWAGDVAINVRDLTANNWVWPNDWTPNADNATADKYFTAQPNHKYRLELKNVYYNNTIQYSIPYDQIYVKDCPSTATLDANAGASKFGAVNQNISFSNSIDLSNLTKVNGDIYTYKIESTGGVPLPSAGLVGSTNKQLSSGGVVSNYNFVPTVPGSYCRKITLEPTPRPGYATYIDKSAEQCIYVNKVPTGSGNIGTSPISVNMEKNNPAKFNVGYTIEYGPGGCPPAGSGLTTTLTGQYQIAAPVNKNIAINDIIGNGNCPGSFSQNVTLDNGQSNSLNSANPGNSVSYRTVINGVNSANANITVFEVPYARFYGNDIYARSGNIKFNDTDTDNRVGGSVPSGFDGRGSVAQYAAIASGSISLDTSAFRPATGNWWDTPPPKGNNLPGSSLTSMKSVSDQIGALRMPAGCKTGFSEFSGSETQCFEITGNQDLGNTLSSYSKKYTLKANGDVYITNNITQGAADYTNPTTTPVLLIAAKNIYIDKSVERVDAILMASNSIITCTDGSNPNLPLRANWDTDCRKTLTVNGSLSAANIEFRRSVGTRLLAPIGPPNIDTANGYATCRSYAGIKNCYPRGYGTASNSPTAQEINTSGGTAELINFPAYLYFAKPYLFDESSDTYNSSYIAPPRL